MFLLLNISHLKNTFISSVLFYFVMLEFDDINFILSDRRYIMNVQDLLEIEAEERQRLDEKKRARTAPSKTPRKTWDVGSVELTTDRGKRKLRAPGMQLYFKTFF